MSEEKKNTDGRKASLKSVLVVDDEVDFANTCSLVLETLGYEASTALSADEAMRILESNPVDAILLDVLLKEANGLLVLKQLKIKFPNLIVIMMSAHVSVRWAVDALHAGAVDFLVKPFDMNELKRSLARAFGMSVRGRHTGLYGGGAKTDEWHIRGRSRSINKLNSMIAKVGPTEISTLLVGATGTGKEIVARSIHENSPRRGEVFMPIECGALQGSLLESELFGHEMGAFTGAARTRIGIFEQAGGGTIFFDDVGELSPDAQVRLLRVLEDGTFRRLGGTKELKADVRIIAATSVDLETIESFRTDLFYRLSVVTINLPRLVDHIEDVPLFADYFLKAHAREGSVVERFSPSAMAALEHYSWPGNVRELENVVERCCAMARGIEIELSDLPSKIIKEGHQSGGALRTLRDIKRDAIIHTLRAVNYDRTKAASVLGINRSTLYRNMVEFGIDDAQEKK